MLKLFFRPDPYPKPVIYGYLGVLLIAGFASSAHMFEIQASMITGVAFLVSLIYACKQGKLNFKNNNIARFCSCHFGIAGVMFIYAYFTNKIERSRKILRFGEALLGVHVFFLCYLFMQSEPDISTFEKYVYIAPVARYILLMALGLSMLCLLPGFFVRDVLHFLLFSEIFLLVFVYGKFNFWNVKHRVYFWNQVRIVSDLSFVSVGIVMYIVNTKRKDYSKME